MEADLRNRSEELSPTIRTLMRNCNVSKVASISCYDVDDCNYPDSVLEWLSHFSGFQNTPMNL